MFNLQDKLRALKLKDENKEEEKVIDPYTVKVRKFHSEMNDRDLQEIMQVYGIITRCRVPMDQEYPTTNRGIGFVTFQRSEDASKVIDEGSIKYEFYELPVERAFYSAGMAERNRGGGGGWEDRGGRGGGFRGGDREGGGFRGGRDGDRGGYRGGGDRDGERGGYRGGGDRGGGGYRGGRDGESTGYRGRVDDSVGWGRRQ